MINPPNNTLHGIHLRCPTSSGGKDWIGLLLDDGTIQSHWGKTSKINQFAEKLGNPKKYHALIGEKKAKGYTEVATFNGAAMRWSNQAAIAKPPIGEPPGWAKPNPPDPKKQVQDIFKNTEAPKETVDWDF